MKSICKAILFSLLVFFAPFLSAQSTLTATSIVFTEGSFSNHNGFLDPGEHGYYVITLHNPTTVTVTNVGATLSTSTPGVGLWSPSISYGSIAPGSSVQGSRLVVGANLSVACGTIINFTLTIYLSGGASPQTISFTSRVGNQFSQCEPGPPCTPYTFTPVIFPNATVGIPYNQPWFASGGSGYSSISYGGTFPPGLSPYQTNAVSGTPTQTGSYTFTYNITDPACTGGSKNYTIVVLSQPNLTINNVSHHEGNNTTTTYTFTISLSAPAPAGGVTFDIATADGTATAGSDYVARSLSRQIIPSGSLSYAFDVQSNADLTFEADETFFVNVTNVSGAIVTNGQGVGTIVNDDPALLPQTISFAPLPNKTFGDAPFTLNASASSSLPVRFKIISGAAFLSGNVLTVAGAGNITIEASQPGNESTQAATPVRQTFMVSKAAQTITIDSMVDKTYGDAPFTISAQTTSGLPIDFSVASGYAYISGNTVVITGVGTVVITVSQIGNLNYLPANAQQSFCIAPKKPQKIYGFVQACISTQQYTIDTIPGATYTWSISGGGTLLLNSGGKVNVSWNSTGTHELLVKANNACNIGKNDTTGLKVQVTDLPVPQDVTNLFPVNSSVITNFPLSLSWKTSDTSQVYDLYLWPEGTAQPISSYVANLQTVAYVVYNGNELPGFAPGAKYNWKVVAKNACRQSGGVSGNFTISKLPNLVLQNVQAPDTAFSGKAIELTIKVLNNGGASTRNIRSTDAVYLSRDTILNTQFDAYIGGAGNLASLDSGQQYINTLHATLPQNTIGDYYLFIVINAYNSITETTRSDNNIRRPILIRLTPPPDLQVTVVATPAEAFSGGSIPVTYTVKNKGAGPTNTSKWIDSIYISLEPVFNRATAVKLSVTQAFIQTALLPDSSYTINTMVALPAKVFGTAYIFVMADAKDSVYEFTFENNNINRSDSIQIFVTPPPDFIVTQSSGIPPSISSGELVTSMYTVKNTGATAPAMVERKWVDGFAISPDSIFNINRATFLDYTIPYTRLAPNPCPPKLGQSGGGGGGGGGGSAAISFNPYGSYLNADKNTQEYCNLPPWNVKYYTDTTIIGVDTIYWIKEPCVRFRYHPFMIPDETYSNTISALIPDVPEGTYYLHVYTDFAHAVFEFQQENNNTRATKVQILNPDLVVNNIVIEDTVGSGTNVSLSWIVKNQGHGAVVNKTRKDLVWLSANPVYDPANMIRLDSITYCTAIDSSASLTNQKTIRIPDGLSGVYYLFVETDKDKAIYEGNRETNNYQSKTIKINLTPWPDLRINSVQLSKDSVELDERFMVTYNVSNNGIAPIAGKTWKDLISVDRSTAYDTVHAIKVAEVVRSQSLDTNASYTVNQPISINGSFLNYVGVDSIYYVHVFADGNRDIYEHTAENNNLKSSNKLYIKYPDLAVTVVNGSLSVFSGQNANVSWQVLNKGGKSAFVDHWFDKIYLSADTTLNAGDIEIMAEFIAGGIPSNGTYNRSLNYKVPNGYSGNYYLFVNADTNDFNRDANRANNINTIRYPDGTPMPISITLTPSPDLIVQALDAPSIGYTGQPILIRWQVINIGIGPTLTGGWRENVYLTTNPNPRRSSYIDGTLIGTYTRTGNLGKDSSYADSLRVFIPAILNGNYYLYFITDYPSQVYEHNAENNNDAFSQIFIIRPEPSDLVVQNITMPSQVLAGDTITVSWKVKNIGINPAEGYFTQGVYLSKDSAWSIDDVLVSNTDTTIYISPSGEQLFSKTIRTTGAKEAKYYVIIRTDLTNNIFETNDDNNTGISTDALDVSVLNLPLNVLTAHSLLSKSELYYKLQIPDSLEGETILISLRSYMPVTPNELYIKLGDLLSRSSFDYGYQTANSGNQDIVIPSASTGSYYILAYNNSDSNQHAIMLLAQRIRFSIMSVHTNEGGNTGLVTVKIQGAKFEPGMQLSLQSNALGTIAANSVQYINSTTAFATFNLAGKSVGLYNMIAKKMNDDTTSLPSGFRILQGSGGGFQGGGTTTGGFYCTIRNIGVDELVDFDVQHPSQVRRGQYFQTDINFGNAGNVDVPVPGRLLISMSGSPIALTQEGLAEGKTELYLEFKELNGPEGVLRPGATGSITIFTKGITVGYQAYRLIE